MVLEFDQEHLGDATFMWPSPGNFYPFLSSKFDMKSARWGPQLDDFSGIQIEERISQDHLLQTSRGLMWAHQRIKSQNAECL